MPQECQMHSSVTTSKQLKPGCLCVCVCLCVWVSVSKVNFPVQPQLRRAPFSWGARRQNLGFSYAAEEMLWVCAHHQLQPQGPVAKVQIHVNAKQLQSSHKRETKE